MTSAVAIQGCKPNSKAGTQSDSCKSVSSILTVFQCSRLEPDSISISLIFILCYNDYSHLFNGTVEVLSVKVPFKQLKTYSPVETLAWLSSRFLTHKNRKHRGTCIRHPYFAPLPAENTKWLQRLFRLKVFLVFNVFFLVITIKAIRQNCIRKYCNNFGVYTLPTGPNTRD